MKRALFLLLVGALATGCARVRPWQRESLARPEMQQPPWPMVARGQQHMLQVRETSQGGYGSGGGGCGCN